MGGPESCFNTVREPYLKIKDKKEEPGGSNDVNDDGNDDSMDSAPASPFDDRAVYRQILAFMEPGENVSKALRRLGGGASLSASERLKRKKAGLSIETKGDPTKVTELTELANRLLTKTGNMNVYQESYSYIKNLVSQSSSKSADDILDMYADDFDTKEKERIGKKDGESSVVDDDMEKEPPLMWEYKERKEDEKIIGPFTSEQMQAFVDAGKLTSETWVRKVGVDGPFYSSKRVDFELYS